MPTLCRTATLVAKTTISKWRVVATIRQLLQLPTRGKSAFGGLRAIAPLQPPSNFQDALVFQSHQLPLYRNERLKWQILLSSHSQGNATQAMLLTNPLAFPETVQQTGQKHFSAISKPHLIKKRTIVKSNVIKLKITFKFDIWSIFDV